MKCSQCYASATYKCCSSKYFCPFHFEPHFASARGHNPEKIDKLLTPYELDRLRSELVSRINHLKSAKSEITAKTCDLIRKIKELKNKLSAKIEATLQSYFSLLNVKEICKSDGIEISVLRQTSLEVPAFNLMEIEKIMEIPFNFEVKNTEDLWKKAKWERNRFYLTHCSEFTCGKISKDEKFFITGSNDSCLRVWDAESITQVYIYEGHTRPILCLELSQNSQYAFSGSQDRTLRIWDLHSKKQKAVLKHPGQVQSIVFIKKSGIIVSGSSSADSQGEINIWEFRGLSLINKIELAFTQLRCFLHLENQPILLLSTGYSIRFLNLESCELEIRDVKHKGKINCFLVTEDNRTLITGCEDAKIFIWDLDSIIPVYQLASHTDSITSLAFTKGGLSIVSGSKDKSIRLWCLKSFTQVLKFEDYLNYSVTLLSFESNFIILMNDSSFGFVDVSRVSFRKTLRLRKFKAGTEQFIANSKVSYVADSRSTIWNLNENVEDCLVISDVVPTFVEIFGGEYGLIADMNNIMYWNLKRNEKIALLHGNDGKALCGCFNFDGSKAALGFKNNTVILWSLSNISQEQEKNHSNIGVFSRGLFNYFEKPKKTPEGISIQYSDINLPHNNSVKAVKFTKNPQLLVTGGKDLKVIIWELYTKTQLAVLKGHQSEIIELNITEGDKYILSFGYTKKNQQYEGVKVWNLADKHLVLEFNIQKEAKSWFKYNKFLFDPFRKFLL